jgi:hypothetical protein
MVGARARDSPCYRDLLLADIARRREGKLKTGEALASGPGLSFLVRWHARGPICPLKWKSEEQCANSDSIAEFHTASRVDGLSASASGAKRTL